MKKILTLVCSIFLCIGLCACDNAKELSPIHYQDKFECVYDKATTAIYVDVETKVMYLFVKRGYAGGLVMMVDGNGQPLLWEGEIK